MRNYAKSRIEYSFVLTLFCSLHLWRVPLEDLCVATLHSECRLASPGHSLKISHSTGSAWICQASQRCPKHRGRSRQRLELEAVGMVAHRSWLSLAAVMTNSRIPPKAYSTPHLQGGPENGDHVDYAHLKQVWYDMYDFDVSWKINEASFLIF